MGKRTDKSSADKERGTVLDRQAIVFAQINLINQNKIHLCDVKEQS
jgi:hypothetical protein